MLTVSSAQRGFTLHVYITDKYLKTIMRPFCVLMLLQEYRNVFVCEIMMENYWWCYVGSVCVCVCVIKLKLCCWCRAVSLSLSLSVCVCDSVSVWCVVEHGCLRKNVGAGCSGIDILKVKVLDSDKCFSETQGFVSPVTPGHFSLPFWDLTLSALALHSSALPIS